MRAIVAVVLFQSIAGTAFAADTLLTPVAAPPPAVVTDSVAKVVSKPADSNLFTSTPRVGEWKDGMKPTPLCPRMAMPGKMPECPRMSQEDPSCCSGMDPETWGIGARVLGSTSELLFHFPVSSRAEVAVRAGWNSTTTSEDDPWVDSRYRLEEVTTAGDTFITNQNLTGSGHLEATTNTVRVAIQLLGDVPKGKGVDLLVGAGPQMLWQWADSTNATDGVSKDAIPLHLSSTSSSWTIGAGLLASLGARWWFVPGRLALVAELQAGVDWSYTSQESDLSTVRRTTYQNPVGVNYYTSQVTASGSTTRSTWWSISTNSATCSVGIDAFF